METKAFSVSLEKNPLISIKVIPGHFTTNNMHTNCYLDVSALKSNTMVAKDVAHEMAIPYVSSIPVDTIVCMEKTEVIGAYVAQHLIHDSASISGGNTIHVVSPVSNVYGNLIFPGSITEWISGKHILLIIATVSSGRTLNSAVECISYYGGRLTGISSLYLASGVNLKYNVRSIFTSEDIPDYKLYNPSECEMCRNGWELDAIISSEGYTKIE